MLNGLKKMQKLNYKVLILTAFGSANASANIVNDVGDWVSDNKGTTAMIGIGALATASVVVKPLKWLLSALALNETTKVINAIL
jgi:hypothetical protein